MSLLRVSGLKYRIGQSEILQGVNLNIERGEMVGLIGPNGSGKTTLFNCLSGFYMPTSGEISFSGRNVTRMLPHKRALLGMGRTFQHFGVFREMTVMENMLVAIEGRQQWWQNFLPWGKINRDNREKAIEYLEQVGLAKRADERAASLSGGQMRLLEIIRTLAFGAELFLLDEPTAGVSPKMKDDIIKLLQKLQEMGKTVLIIEHDIEFIQQFCERVVVLDVGQVVLDDTPGNVRKNKKLQEIYFGSNNSDK